MGKTALLDEVRSRAGQARVLVARGVDIERAFALGVTRQLLEPPLRHADGATRERWLTGAVLAEAVLRGDTGAVEAGTAFNALYWVLAAMTADSPVLLIVDDVHWCDRESMAWIGFVVRRLEGLRLTVLLAARPPEQEIPDRAFMTLRADPQVTTIALDPLTRDATAQIVRRELGAADDAFVAACHAPVPATPSSCGSCCRRRASSGVTPSARKRRPHRVADVGRAAAGRARSSHRAGRPCAGRRARGGAAGRRCPCSAGGGVRADVTRGGDPRRTGAAARRVARPRRALELSSPAAAVGRARGAR